MTVFSRLAALCIRLLLLAMVCFVMLGCQRPREELKHSLWAAGSVSNRSANDIWIEYGAVSDAVVGIYRDFDGDGLVDEYLLLNGAPTTVFTSSGHNGSLDVVRGIGEPLDATKRLRKGSPDAGPYTRAALDELARLYPRNPS